MLLVRLLVNLWKLLHVLCICQLLFVIIIYGWYQSITIKRIQSSCQSYISYCIKAWLIYLAYDIYAVGRITYRSANIGLQAAQLRLLTVFLFPMYVRTDACSPVVLSCNKTSSLVMLTLIETCSPVVFILK